MRHTTVRRLTYALSFLLALSVALVTYINSSALARVVSATGITTVYTVGFIVAVCALLIAPRILRGAGDVRATAVFFGLEIVALLGLAGNPTPHVFLACFFAQLVLPQLLAMDLDMFLARAAETTTMGTARGSLLLALNSAFVFGPGAAGIILGNGEAYESVYRIAAYILVPALLITLLFFKHYRDPLYETPRIVAGLKRLFKNRALRASATLNFLLRFFYAIMVIYTPLYLHGTVGLPWNDIGIIFTIMLLPFVLFDYPLGRLADTRFGEKEFLFTGILIMSITTGILAFVSSASVWLWAALLFGTRVGASFVESMTDIYFFKNVSERDIESMSLYRIVEPLAYIVAPLIAALIAVAGDTRLVFLAVGCILLLGLPVTLHITDTR